MKYKIVVSEKLEKQLKKISNKIAKKIMIKIEGLSNNPRPHDVKKLKGDQRQLKVTFNDNYFYRLSKKKSKKKFEVCPIRGVFTLLSC